MQFPSLILILGFPTAFLEVPAACLRDISSGFPGVSVAYLGDIRNVFPGIPAVCFGENATKFWVGLQSDTADFRSDCDWFLGLHAAVLRVVANR